jgi:hypothetical protein
MSIKDRVTKEKKEKTKTIPLKHKPDLVVRPRFL